MHLFISFALEKKQEKRKIVHFYPTKNHFQKKCKKKRNQFLHSNVALPSTYTNEYT